jgi:hypothetical protein
MMFTDTKKLKGLVIRATDGELGKVDQLYFDDEYWTIRYFTVETGNWLDGRKVLLSPYAVRSIDWENGRIDVSLSMKQVENSPDVDTHRPVSRQREVEYLGYYGYPNYWGGSYLWGAEMYPGGLPIPDSFTSETIEAVADRARRASADSHLRGTDEVSGYHIEAIDGEIGHVDRFIVEEKAWAIRYLEVATQNWWPGKKVLVSPDWVRRVSWGQSKVIVALTREEIQKCPEYFDDEGLTREYEDRIHFHYGKPPYWVKDANRSASLPMAAGRV